MTWTIRIFVLHLLRSVTARVLLLVYAILLAWWNLAVPASGRSDTAILAAIELDWPRWLVYAWLLVVAALPRAKAESLHLLATSRAALTPRRAASASRGTRLGSWAQVRLVTEVGTLYLLGCVLTSLCVVARGEVFHVKPLIVGFLLSLAATLQVSAISTIVAGRSRVTWLSAALMALVEVWQGRLSGDWGLGLGLVLVWAGLGSVLAAIERRSPEPTIEEAKIRCS